MAPINRRAFMAAAAAALPFLAERGGAAPPRPGRPRGIGSANAVPALERAMGLIASGTDPLEAVVEGVTLVEDDPDDMSVGYGGLPNEQGIVELDASVMHGPTHKAGAVAALRNVRHPSKVALEILRRTDHVLLVGEGALQFARALGFPEEDLLTEKARQAWLRWKASLNPQDDWLDPGQQVDTSARAPSTEGTIHVSAVDARGDIGACTSTSGLSYKLPGRVGDSPIIGAGLFVDNPVGAAGATGRGEAVIQSAGAHQVVRHMEEGMEPTEACLRVLRWIAGHTKRPDLQNERGEPAFQVTLYALRADGASGSAAMRRGAKYAVHDGTAARVEPCTCLYE
jgi:N4-(beta-N-acetylglucosaminyl)-L-asparaginase